MADKNPNAFSYKTISDLKNKITEMGLSIPLSDQVDAGLVRFVEPLVIEGRNIPNRFCIQPMEGCDGLPDGSPSELTVRKYRRFAEGGAGMLWLEATAVAEQGKANPRQLSLTKKSLPKFKQLADVILENARDKDGNRIRPFLVLQLTHSGRYSKPYGQAAPIIMHHSPYLDPTHNLPADYPLITDRELDALQEDYVASALLAQECGFDAVDVKACHGYLLHEMLSAFTRKESRYGGSFENRTRFLTETIAKVKRAVPAMVVTSRLSVYDHVAHPYGWGMQQSGELQADLTEPFRLIEQLQALGVTLVNVAVGNPYYNPHIERPYDFPIVGFKLPPEHPLVLIDRTMQLTGAVTKRFPAMTVATVGFTWLREYWPHAALGALNHQVGHIIGLGRLALAHPSFVNDLLRDGFVKRSKTCITCSSCTQIMRDGGTSGCPIRDSEVYGPIYFAGRLGNEQYVRSLAMQCKNCWGGACSSGCPAGIDVAGFINAFIEGDVKLSYDILRTSNVLAETCAYTCPADVQCEKKCSAGILSRTTVPVHEIQKFVSIAARKQGFTAVKAGKPVNKRVAIIGFGPAGIACAVALIERGVAVTVYESTATSGGTSAAVIPTMRLPLSTMASEVDSLKLSETALFSVRYSTPVNALNSLDVLLNQEQFDAVFIATGMTHSVGLPFDVKPHGVLGALDFLRMTRTVSMVLKPGTAVAVVGGGNTAMDAAMACRDAGVRDVYLMYRRSFAELPAWPREVDHALRNGVHFLILN